MTDTLPSARESWDDYFMRLAFLAATRATCTRLKVGAVLVKDNRARSTGYNGSPSGAPHCLDDGCLMRDGSCVRTVHAEVNCLMESAHEFHVGGTVYCTDRPCMACTNVLANSGISRVVYARPYHRDIELVERLFSDAGVRLEHRPVSDGLLAALQTFSVA